MLIPMQDCEKLAVWEHAHRIAVNVQRVTARIARRDNSGLIVLLRRMREIAPHSLHPPTAEDLQPETRHREPSANGN